jgi:exportin-2 (importin alpha re-exporter)
MTSDMETLAQLLEATLDHRQHKQGKLSFGMVGLLVELLAHFTSGGRSQDRREETWVLASPAQYRRLGVSAAEHTTFGGALLQEFYQIQLGSKYLALAPTAEYSEELLQDEEGTYKLPENEVVTIKKELIGLMISVPPSIQAQLGETISVIADSDFWTRWDTLVDVNFPLHTFIQWKDSDFA